MYSVAIKQSAMEANPAVAELADGDGTTLEFDSRPAAEALAHQLSERGPRVRIQKAAPQDPADVDGYLIRFPRRYRHEPRPTAGGGLTFDLTANLYGELGRSLVAGTYGISPALRYYLLTEREGIDEATHSLRRVVEPALPGPLRSAVSWSPDCLVVVRRRGDGEEVARYYCEVKTGAASFQRGQLDDMRAVAARYHVLKIRVDIEQLPAEYTVRIAPVRPG